MGDIAKSVLGGAWTLIVGWILPTGLNLAVCFLTVAPTLRHTAPVAHLWPRTGAGTTLLLLCASLLLGLVLSALQTPLYRILEGYSLWPSWAYERGCVRQRAAKQRLADRIALLRLERRARTAAPLAAADTESLARLRADPRLAATAGRDRRRTAAQRALLGERLSRYPADDDQIAPTLLGNAIRRLEEYGYDRFRLDTQVLWNELTGTAPEQIRRQAELSRTNADFFVALLYGHAALAAVALAALAAPDPPVAVLLGTAAALVLLLPVWYRCAVNATDEWAAAVRALVNTGRKPLAEALGVVLPHRLADERRMWRLLSTLHRRPYHERAAALDAYRVTLPGTDQPNGPPTG
ncbi:hypothetical protein [Streptomyces chattanoogensis]|uniref:Uncharacterized protein n=1 Tax=Streptomyces chattanoogensis TaxID=66876 RepID=A0A0N0XR08_9ACTN|nr:hypothetical protein [Streptomyces chattanoogensis]KPC59396.1 hypothetical protein ADL29_35725 [Streptomyces chattanoogensis]